MERIDIPGLAVLLMHVFMYQNEILLDRGMDNIWTKELYLNNNEK